MKVNVRLLAAFALGLLAGALIMYAGSSLLPKTTIQDRLREMQLSFSQQTLSATSLRDAKGISEFDDLEFLKRAYDEKQSAKGTYDALHVYLDTDKNIVWFELWLDGVPTNLEYLGFYVYHDID